MLTFWTSRRSNLDPESTQSLLRSSSEKPEDEDVLWEQIEKLAEFSFAHLIKHGPLNIGDGTFPNYTGSSEGKRTLGKYFERQFLLQLMQKEEHLALEFLAQLPQREFICEMHLDEVDEFSESLVSKVFHSCPQIELLDLSRTQITERSLLDISNDCLSNLRRLILNGCEQLKDEDALQSFLSKTELEELDLSHTSITGRALSTCSPTLRKLRLLGCKRLDDKQFLGFMQKAKNLQDLILSYTNTTGKGLASLPSDNQLELLAFCNCPWLQESFLMQFTPKARKLQTLLLSRTPTTGKALTSFPDNNELRSAEFEHCSHLEESSLMQFMPKMANLKRLSLVGTPTTGEALLNLPRNCALQFLWIEECPNLQQSHLQEFLRSAKFLKVLSVDTAMIGDSLSEFLKLLPKGNCLERLEIHNPDESFRTLKEEQLRQLLS